MAAEAQAIPNSAGRTRFWLRKLHSLSGVVPVGIFLILHLFTNFFSSKGGEPFAEHADDIARLPFVLLVEIGIVWLPLAYHAVYGLVMMQDTQWSTMSVQRGTNYAYFLQRITGIIAFAFVAVHFYQLRLRKQDDWLGAHLFNETKVLLTGPGGTFWTIIYLIGTFSAIYHFSNGIRTFAMAWGIAVGERAKKGAGALGALVGLALSYFAISSVVGFYSSPCYLPAPEYFRSSLAREHGTEEGSFRDESYAQCRQIDPRPPVVVGK